VVITYAILGQLGVATSIGSSGVPALAWVALYTCSACGGIVRGDTQAAHTRWHVAITTGETK